VWTLSLPEITVDLLFPLFFPQYSPFFLQCFSVAPLFLPFFILGLQDYWSTADCFYPVFSVLSFFPPPTSAEIDLKSSSLPWFSTPLAFSWIFSAPLSFLPLGRPFLSMSKAIGVPHGGKDPFLLLENDSNRSCPSPLR